MDYRVILSRPNVRDSLVHFPSPRYMSQSTSKKPKLKSAARPAEGVLVHFWKAWLVQMGGIPPTRTGIVGKHFLWGGESQKFEL